MPCKIEFDGLHIFYKHSPYIEKADGLSRHECAIYGFKLTIHFHIWFFCDATDRQLFVCRSFFLLKTFQKLQNNFYNGNNYV